MPGESGRAGTNERIRQRGRKAPLAWRFPPQSYSLVCGVHLPPRSRVSSLRFGFHAGVALGTGHDDAAFSFGHRKRLTAGGAFKEGFGFAVLPHLLAVRAWRFRSSALVFPELGRDDEYDEALVPPRRSPTTGMRPTRCLKARFSCSRAASFLESARISAPHHNGKRYIGKGLD